LFPFWFNIQFEKYKIPLVAKVSASPEYAQALGLVSQVPVAIGGTAWQLPRIQTVYRCNVTAIAIPHSTSHTGLVHMILTILIFPAARMRLLMEATVAVGSTTEVEVGQIKIIVQSTYTSTIKHLH